MRNLIQCGIRNFIQCGMKGRVAPQKPHLVSGENAKSIPTSLTARSASNFTMSEANNFTDEVNFTRRQANFTVRRACRMRNAGSRNNQIILSLTASGVSNFTIRSKRITSLTKSTSLLALRATSLGVSRSFTQAKRAIHQVIISAKRSLILSLLRYPPARPRPSCFC